MSAARPRSRAEKAIVFIASTTGTMPAFLVTSMWLIVPSWRNFFFCSVCVAFIGVVLTVVSFWLMCGDLLTGACVTDRAIAEKEKATTGRYGVSGGGKSPHPRWPPPLRAGVAFCVAYCHWSYAGVKRRFGSRHEKV